MKVIQSIKSKIKKPIKPKKVTQAMCDKLLTPIVKKYHPKCLLCGHDTQVAHHFIKKSTCLNLRYDMENLINLCNPCHFRLHFNDEGMWNGRIALMKGEMWLNYLESKKHKLIKPDYNKTYEDLKIMLAN